MVWQGFNAALSRGEIRTAFRNAIHVIKTLFFAGEKLRKLLEKADFFMKLADQYKFLMAKLILSVFRETISTLIDKGESTNSTANNATNQDANQPELVSG